MIKWSIISINMSYTSLFSISVILAIFIGSQGYDPYFKAISALGSSLITPFPFLFDIKAYIGSSLLIISLIFIKKKLTYLRNLNNGSYRGEVIHENVIKLGLMMGIIGVIAYIFAGVFNIDRGGPNGIYHYLFAVVLFGGLIISISTFSIYILIHKIKFPRIYPIFGLTVPFLSVIMWKITGILLFEWIAFFSILGFLIPFQSKRIIQKLLTLTEVK